MWRQADNPLAPSDKYEVRRTFSAARLHSVSHGKKKKEGPRSYHANLLAALPRSHSVIKLWLQLTDPFVARTPIREYFFSIPHFSRHLHFTGEGGAMRIEIADDSFAYGTC